MPIRKRIAILLTSQISSRKFSIPSIFFSSDFRKIFFQFFDSGPIEPLSSYNTPPSTSTSLREFPCVTHVILAYLREWWFGHADRDTVSSCNKQIPRSTILILLKCAQNDKMQFFQKVAHEAYALNLTDLTHMPDGRLFQKTDKKSPKNALFRVLFSKVGHGAYALKTLRS